MSGDERKIHLLIVDDEEKFLESIAKRLRLKDFDVATERESEVFRGA